MYYISTYCLPVGVFRNLLGYFLRASLDCLLGSRMPFCLGLESIRSYQHTINLLYYRQMWTHAKPRDLGEFFSDCCYTSTSTQQRISNLKNLNLNSKFHFRGSKICLPGTESSFSITLNISRVTRIIHVDFLAKSRLTYHQVQGM